MSDITWTNERRKLSELTPREDNPRLITKAQAERLVKSFDKFAQVETLAVNPDGRILNGHQRYFVLLAAYDDPDYEVDVRVASRPLTKREWQELTVLLHEGTTGEWSWEGLANWEGVDTEDLVDWGFDLNKLLGAGWDVDGGNDEPPPLAQMDKADELAQKYGTATGQIWELGEHRLAVGDCTDGELVRRLIGGAVIGAVVTDPPYGINREGIINDDPEGLRVLFDGALAVMPIRDAVVIAFQSPRLFPVWLDAVRAAGHKFERMLWMYKSNDETFPWRGWLQKSEAILLSSVGKPEWVRVDPFAHDCYSPTTLGRELPKEWGKAHASVKPIVVVSDLTARIGGDVYDPFLGSGTTLIACANLKRKCYAVEISLAYAAVAIQRWVDLTGGTPVLLTRPGVGLTPERGE